MCVACQGSFTNITTTKMSSLSGAGGGGGGGGQLFYRLYIQNGLSHAPRTFTIRLSAPNTTRCEVTINAEENTGYSSVGAWPCAAYRLG